MKTQEEWRVLYLAGAPSARYRVAEAQTPPDPRDPQQQARLGTQASPVSGEQPAHLRGSGRSCGVRKGAWGRGHGVSRAGGVDVSEAQPVGASSRTEKARAPRRGEKLPSSRGAFPQVCGAVSSHLLVTFCQQRRVTDGGSAASPFPASFQKHFSVNLARFLLDRKFRVRRFKPTVLGIPPDGAGRTGARSALDLSRSSDFIYVRFADLLVYS